MAEFSDTIADWLLDTEGGYVDHPRDPGGATNMGITYKTLGAWRGEMITKQDVRQLGRAEALAIYRSEYWNAVRGDDLPIGLDYAVFDYAVHSGPDRAAKDLQGCLGVAEDGIIGAQTLWAMRTRGTSDLIRLLCERRWDFMRGLSNFGAFKTGWRRRLWGEQSGIQPGNDTGVADRAMRLAQGRETTAPKPKPSEGRAPPMPMPKPPLRPEVIAPLGALLSAIATALTQLGGLGAPVTWAIALAVVAGTGLVVMWGVRRIKNAT